MNFTSCAATALSLFGAACIQEPRAQDSAPAIPRPAAQVAAVPEPDFDTVLLVSVDGLRSDALIAVPGALPGFDRLRQGAGTLNARTDPDRTVTLPNHTGMITGRLVEGPTGHGWIRNDEVQDGETIHGNARTYVASVFDVAHDRGAWTGIFCGKPKFHLYDDSYDATRGAEDALPPDQGRDKIDRFFVDPAPSKLADALLAELTREDAAAKRFFFVHFATPDLTAHVKGWDVTPGSAYLKAVGEVDVALARILDSVESSAKLRGHTALVLTADHGGGAPFKSHDQPHMWVDYVIPFLVWTGGSAPEELYARNPATRRDPGLGRPRPGDGNLPPVRNADAGNLCLDLLGMPAIPGSTVNAAQDLRTVVLAH
ncbi:MAG: alkaline phosphatase family protein [Planctomycetota bacterium]|nr:alkaline phosphatase family protein [Planctomycetota bacterium]